MTEQWKTVRGYEGLYCVSNTGRVVALPKNSRGERELKPCNIRGYRNVKLVKNGIYKNHYVHRLVAEAFIENPNQLPEVNHKDENKTNNCVENLEWCDRKYNCNYGNGQQKRLGSVKLKGGAKCKRGGNHPKAKLSQAKINYIRLVYTPGDSDHGSRALGRQFGVSHNTIRAVVEGRTWNGETKQIPLPL